MIKNDRLQLERNILKLRTIMSQLKKKAFYTLLFATPIALSLAIIENENSLFPTLSKNEKHALSTDEKAQLTRAQGDALFICKKYKQALHQYAGAIELSTNSPLFQSEVLKKASEVYTQMGEIELAQEALQKALSLSHSDQRAYAEIHTSLGHLYKQSENIEEALSHYHEALALKTSFQALNNSIYYSAAQCHYSLGQYEQTAKLLQNALDENKTPFAKEKEVNHLLGLTQQQLGNFTEAVKNFKNSDIADEDAVLTQSLYSAVLKLQDEGISYLNSGDTDNALATFLKAIDLNGPSKKINSELHAIAGDLYLQNKAFDEAINQFEASLQLEENSPLTRANLATAYDLIGNLSASAREYSLATDGMTPEFPGYNEIVAEMEVVHENLAAHYLNTAENIGEEIFSPTQCNNLLTASHLKGVSDATRSQLHFYLGKALSTHNRFLESAEHYRNASSICGDDIELKQAAILSMADSYSNGKSFEKAFASYQEAKELFSEDEEVLSLIDDELDLLVENKAHHFFETGLSHLSEHNAEQALETFQNGLLSNPQNPLTISKLHFGMGQAHLEMGDYIRAVSELQNSLTFEFNDNDFKAKIHCVLAAVHEKEGNIARAERVCREGLSFKPTSSVLCSQMEKMMGDFAIAEANFPAAIEHYQKALSHSQNSPAARAMLHFKIGSIFKSRNSIGEAIEHFEMALEEKELPVQQNLKIRMALYDIYKQSKQYQKGIDTMRVALMMDISDEMRAYVYNNIAISFFLSGHQKNALRSYEKALSHDSIGNALKSRIYYNLCFALKKEADYAQIIQNCSKALSLEHNDENIKKQLQKQLYDAMHLKEQIHNTNRE